MEKYIKVQLILDLLKIMLFYFLAAPIMRVLFAQGSGKERATKWVPVATDITDSTDCGTGTLQIRTLWWEADGALGEHLGPSALQTHRDSNSLLNYSYIPPQLYPFHSQAD